MYDLSLEDNLDAPPVYLINESENNNIFGQPYFNNQQQNPHTYKEYNGYSQNYNSNNYMFPYDQPYAYRNNNQQQN